MEMRDDERIGLYTAISSHGAAREAHVNAICPGNLHDSPLWTACPKAWPTQVACNEGFGEQQVRQIYIDDRVPMKRSCTHADVCNRVVFLTSDQSSYMTGQAINVTGGREMH